MTNKLLALCAALLLPASAFGAAGTVPAGGSGSGDLTLLPYLSQSNSAYIFPNVWRQVSGGKPLRFMWMGDSIGNLTGDEIVSALVPFYGRNGAGMNGANYLVANLDAVATNVTRLTNWFIGYQEIGTGGRLTFSNLFTSWTWADRCGVEFLSQSNGGTFKIQLQTNGGAFADVLTGIATGTTNGQAIGGLPIGNATNVTMLPGYYQARVVQTAGGVVSILGCDLWATNNPGVRVTYGNASGTTIQDMSGVPATIAGPVLRHLAPDLILIEGTTDPTASVQDAFLTLYTNSFVNLTNTDLLYLGTTPVDSSYAFDYAAFNAAMRAVALAKGRFFFDQSYISGTFSNMQAYGTSGDGLHRSNNLSRACAAAVMQIMGLYDSPIDNSGRLLTRSNMFTGPVTFSNTVTIAGASGQLIISDLNATTLPSAPGAYPFGTVMDAFGGGQSRFGYRNSLANGGGTVYCFRFHGGYGTPILPITMGDPLGDKDFPWRGIHTNAVDFGVGGFTNNFEMGLWTIAGAGNGNTNYTLLASKGAMFLGSSNVNISAVMETPAFAQRTFTAYITNLSADTWGIGFSSVTNRWRWWGLQGGGTNAPNVLTNNTALVLEGKCRGSNIVATYYYVRPGL